MYIILPIKKSCWVFSVIGWSSTLHFSFRCTCKFIWVRPQGLLISPAFSSPLIPRPCPRALVLWLHFSGSPTQRHRQQLHSHFTPAAHLHYINTWYSCGAGVYVCRVYWGVHSNEKYGIYIDVLGSQLYKFLDFKVCKANKMLNRNTLLFNFLASHRSVKVAKSFYR